MVTHLTTNLPVKGLSTPERTGRPVLPHLWCYVKEKCKLSTHIVMCLSAMLEPIKTLAKRHFLPMEEHNVTADTAIHYHVPLTLSRSLNLSCSDLRIFLFSFVFWFLAFLFTSTLLSCPFSALLSSLFFILISFAWALPGPHYTSFGLEGLPSCSI